MPVCMEETLPDHLLPITTKKRSPYWKNSAAFLAFVKGRKLYKKKEIPLIFTGV